MDYPKVGEKWANDYGNIHVVVRVNPLNRTIRTKWKDQTFNFDLEYWRVRQFHRHNPGFWRRIAILFGFVRP